MKEPARESVGPWALLSMVWCSPVLVLILTEGVAAVSVAINLTSVIWVMGILLSVAVGRFSRVWGISLIAFPIIWAVCLALMPIEHLRIVVRRNDETKAFVRLVCSLSARPRQERFSMHHGVASHQLRVVALVLPFKPPPPTHQTTHPLLPSPPALQAYFLIGAVHAMLPKTISWKIGHGVCALATMLIGDSLALCLRLGNMSLVRLPLFDVCFPVIAGCLMTLLVHSNAIGLSHDRLAKMRAALADAERRASELEAARRNSLICSALFQRSSCAAHAISHGGTGHAHQHFGDCDEEKQSAGEICGSAGDTYASEDWEAMQLEARASESECSGVSFPPGPPSTDDGDASSAHGGEGPSHGPSILTERMQRKGLQILIEATEALNKRRKPRAARIPLCPSSSLAPALSVAARTAPCKSSSPALVPSLAVAWKPPQGIVEGIRPLQAVFLIGLILLMEPPALLMVSPPQLI